MGLKEAIEKVDLVGLEKAAWSDVRPAVEALLDAQGVRDFKELILTVADALVKKAESKTEQHEAAQGAHQDAQQEAS